MDINNKIYIAGAHSRGTTMGYYIKYLEPSTEIVAYVYDNDESNPKNVGGVPVLKINSDTNLDVEATVYVAMRSINHPHITETLTQCGMKHIVPVDVKLDLDIRNRFLKKYYEAVGRLYLKIDNLDVSMSCNQSNSCKIYVATSAFDKPLREEYELAEYEELIQVGAELTDARIAAVTDNIGDNISSRNKQFCELTGLYWIWKNAKEAIVGLEHYRRHFILEDDWLDKFISNDIDVILPTPLYVGPSLAENYRSRHVASDLDYMLQVMKEIHSDDYETSKSFFEETAIYSPCNMLVIKKSVLDDFCEWLFPILFAVADYIGEHEDVYQDRYPGFMSERLLSYYFEHNRDKYKIVYCDKDFRQ